MYQHVCSPRATILPALIAALALVAGCGDQGEGNDPASLDTTAETSPALTIGEAVTTTTETTTSTAVPTAEPWSMDAAGPGTFETTVMEPGFVLTYGESWVPFQPESRNQLNIEITESSELGCAPCAFLGVNAVQADSPAAVVDFAVANGVELADPEPIEIGGIEAQRYEVTGGAGPIFETEFANFSVDSSDGPARVTVLDVDGSIVAIVELAMPEVADAVQPLSDEVIASIQWSTV
jgi:hypothetical protein